METDDIRFTLMERLCALDDRLRAAGLLRPGQNPPFLDASASEAAALAATVGGIDGPLYFCNVPLRVAGASSAAPLSRQSLTPEK